MSVLTGVGFGLAEPDMADPESSAISPNSFVKVEASHGPIRLAESDSRM